MSIVSLIFIGLIPGFLVFALAAVTGRLALQRILPSGEQFPTDFDDRDDTDLGQ